MGIQKRFRVHKSGDTIQLHGIISDTANFRILDEMLGDRNQFDCSHVISTSWNGLLKLDEYLCSHPGTFILKKVPFHLFQYLRLLPHLRDRYLLEEIELHLISQESRSESQRYLHQTDLDRLSESEVKPFMKLASGEQLIGKDRFICPSRFGQKSESHSPNLSSWYLSHSEQVDFWYDYLSFSSITLSLALDLVQSQQSTLEALLKDLDISVKGLEKCFSLILPDYKPIQGLALEDCSHILSQACHQLTQILTDKSQQLEARLIDLQLLVTTESKQAEESLKLCFAAYIQSMNELLPSISYCEDLGSRTGDQLHLLAQLSKSRQRVRDLSSDAVSEATVNEVREILDIMDPLSEGDWEETKSECLQQFDSIDQNLGRIIVLLQGFDLLRQILEHRQYEKDSIQAFFQGNFASWSEVKDLIFQQINRTLVTDQEKYSCEFFLPDAARLEDNAQKPGDILLF